jgi:chromosome segregation ATPase
MFFQRLAVVIGGFAAGALVRRWQAHDAAAPRRSLDRLSREWKAQVRAHDYRISRLEARSEAHEAKLAEVPSTAQIVSAMDELLGKAMSGLDGRLTAQARSIETLQTTVSQTDELLERVLESLDTLRDPPPEGRA